MCVEEGLSFFSFFLSFFLLLCFLSWLDFLLLVREIDARTTTNAKTKGFLRRREITHISHTHALEEEEEEEDFESTTLSGGGVFSLL